MLICRSGRLQDKRFNLGNACTTCTYTIDGSVYRSEYERVGNMDIIHDNALNELDATAIHN